MKNLLIYINPLKEFGEDYFRLVPVQIDNSLYMGWKPEDILLVTNFEYSYGGVNSIVVPDDLFCEHRRRASKINVICYMLEKGLITSPCWFHDFDAYQAEQFLPIDNILNGKLAGFTEYGFNNNMWNTGSFFFIPEALPIFNLIRRTMNRRRINEEQALLRLTRDNADNINDNIINLNITYNLGRMRNNEENLALADKPIKVFHFHPRMVELYNNVKPLIPILLANLIDINQNKVCQN